MCVYSSKCSVPELFQNKLIKNGPLTLGEPPRPSAIAHTRVDFPDPFGPTTMFKRGPNKALASLYTRKFFILRLTIEPSFQPDGSRRSAPAPEPVSWGLLMGALALMLVVTMIYSTLLLGARPTARRLLSSIPRI